MTFKTGVSRLVLEASQGLRALRRTAHLMCGVGDYETYLTHQRTMHPDVPALDYAAFIRQQQEARYGRGGMRCC